MGESWYISWILQHSRDTISSLSQALPVEVDRHKVQRELVSKGLTKGTIGIMNIHLPNVLSYYDASEMHLEYLDVQDFDWNGFWHIAIFDICVLRSSICPGSIFEELLGWIFPVGCPVWRTVCIWSERLFDRGAKFRQRWRVCFNLDHFIAS